MDYKYSKAVWICVIIFISSSLSFAQKSFTSLDIGLRNPDKFVVVPDSLGNICLYYRDSKNNFFTLVNPEGQVIRTRSFKRNINNEPVESFMGATITDSAFILFIATSPEHETYGTFYISKSDSNDFEIKETKFHYRKGEQYLRAYTDNGFMYVLTINKKEQQVSFVKFLNEKETKANTFSISKEVYHYIKKADFSIIKSTQNYTVPLASADIKMYVSEPDKVILTINDAKGKYTEEYGSDTEILEFNFKKDTVNYYEIPGSNVLNENYYSNSFYYKGKLFRVTMRSSRMGLYITDITTGKLERQYEYDKNSDIDLVADKVIWKGEKTYLRTMDGEKVLDTNKKILKKLSLGTPSISVRSFNGDTLMVLIGSIHIVKISGGGGMAGGSIGAIPGGIPASQPTTVGEASTITWFNSFLIDSTYEIVTELIEEPEFYKIELYKEAIEERGERMKVSLVFKVRNKLYLGYILKRETIFKIVEIL